MEPPWKERVGKLAAGEVHRHEGSDAATIGLDIAKQVFQAHGADKSGKIVFSGAS
jgi:hypothetical protein